MSNVEDNYSDYIVHMSHLTDVIAVLAGFCFTTLTLLVTLLPDPSQIVAQFTLFFMTFLCDLLVFIIGWGSVSIIYFCRKVPPLTKQLKIFNFLSMSGFSLCGLIPVLMFLVIKLTYLALVSGFIWIALMIPSYVVGWKPTRTYRATRARMLTRAREKEKAA